MDARLTYNNYSSPYTNQIRLVSENFKGLAVEVACADKYAALVFKMPLYNKYESLLNGIQYEMRHTAYWWQYRVKESLTEILGTIEFFMKRYNSYYPDLEKILSENKTSDYDKDYLLWYLKELKFYADRVAYKIDIENNRTLKPFNNQITSNQFRLSGQIIPAIQREMRITDNQTRSIQNEIEQVEDLIKAGERALLNNGIGIGGGLLGIALGVGSMLTGGLVSGAIALIAGIIGLVTSSISFSRTERELKNQREQHKGLLTKLQQLNFDALYLKSMESNFVTIAQQGRTVINVFNTLMLRWSSVINSLDELQYKIKYLTTNILNDHLLFIKGAFRDIDQEFRIMQEKISQYGILISLPIQQERIIKQIPIQPMAMVTPLLNADSIVKPPFWLPNKLFFNAESLRNNRTYNC